ncbi:MAG: DUF2294 domain-containing protein [Solirubrobacteraceae bacterium]
MSTAGRRPDGELAAAISNAVVQALARTTGRGPTKAKTTLGDNGVFVVLQDTLSRGEQTLADAGEGAAVLDLRRRWQEVMRADISREIEQLTDRKVIGFMSDNHIDPDLAVEVFVLEPLAPPDVQLNYNAARPLPSTAVPTGEHADGENGPSPRAGPRSGPAAVLLLEPMARRERRVLRSRAVASVVADLAAALDDFHHSWASRVKTGAKLLEFASN